MDSSPLDRAHSKNIFNFDDARLTPKAPQQKTNDRTLQPNMRVGQPLNSLLYSAGWLTDASRLGAVTLIKPQESSDDEACVDDDFSLNELFGSLPSDRIETSTVDARYLPPLTLVVSVYDPQSKSEPQVSADKVRQLLAQGENPRECDPVYRRSPLHWACIHADITTIQVLCDALAASVPESRQRVIPGIAQDLSQPDVNGLTPLQAVLKLRRVPGQAELVSYLIERGADLAGPNWVGAELLFADFLTLDIARAVLASGVKLSCRDRLNATPLLKAVLHDDTTLVKFFLQQGADPNACSFLGRAALNHDDLSVEVAALLIEHGANVNLADEYGMTPLMFACQDNNWALMQLLLRHGACVDASSRDGMTVADYAPDGETARLLTTERGLAHSM